MLLYGGHTVIMTIIFLGHWCVHNSNQNSFLTETVLLRIARALFRPLNGFVRQ